jgi:hypothetical protein
LTKVVDRIAVEVSEVVAQIVPLASHVREHLLAERVFFKHRAVALVSALEEVLQEPG